MNSLELRQSRYLAQRAVEEQDRQRLAVLNAPVKNDPRLFEPVPVRVVLPFCVGGRQQTIGAIVTLENHTALSLEASGKVQLL